MYVCVERYRPRSPLHCAVVALVSLVSLCGATSLSRADRFVGLHFFNPVQLMKLCEVVKTEHCSDEAFDTCKVQQRCHCRVSTVLGHFSVRWMGF